MPIHCMSPWEGWLVQLRLVHQGFMAWLSLPLCMAGEMATNSNHSKQQDPFPSSWTGIRYQIFSYPASTHWGFSLK